MSKATKQVAVSRDPVPMSWWGKDHWSTLLYIETRIVDHEGVPDARQMRCDEARHPGLAHACPSGSKKYPTRLRNDVELPDHDDWDCLSDAEDAGLIVIGGTGIAPTYELTSRGWTIINALRRWRAEGKPTYKFQLREDNPLLL